MTRGLASVIGSALFVTLACTEEPPIDRGPEPMRVSTRSADARTPGSVDADPTATETEGAVAAPEPDDDWIAERPPLDPEIERALELISASGLRFIDPASEPDEPPTEYTAKEFMLMLRTKGDWIGYDLVEREAWLDGVATRSFKTQLAYQVVLADGTTRELRPWLDAALASKQAPE